VNHTLADFRDSESELSRFRGRLLVAGAVVVLGFALLVARLVTLQVLRHDELATRAESNRIALLPVPPNRGLILDRNGIVLANNYSAYTLEITPSRSIDLEATIDGLAQLIEVTPRDRKRFKRLMDDARGFESLPIRTRLTDEEVARFSAQRFRFPGVEIKARLFRSYPQGELGAHVVGYIGRINPSEKEALEESEDAANYRGTEVIGKLGIEQRYEAELHGQTGYEEVETSAGGRAVRRLRSNPPTPGNTVHLSIDIKLQALVERMFGERRGALVAIDPRNGELLAFVSKPSFDPNLFVDGIDVDSWRELNESLDKPLLNRALRGTYPPGSTFKPFMAIAALESNKRTPQQGINDTGSFMFGNHRFRSHGDGGLGWVDMHRSIVKSSNVYYYQLAADMGVDLIHDQLEPFGLGRKTGIDLQGEVTGVLPSTAWKRKTYKKPELQRWYAGETISLGIGQGYNNFTMLQMASATATLVSGGRRFEPRLVREIEDVVTRARRPAPSEALPALALKPEHVEVIRRALHGVTQEGTSTRIFVGAPYKSGGKTGTAQAVGIKQDQKYDKNKLEEYLRDHSIYTAFAPLDAPQVALAVVVENAGFGAEAAAPIARRVLDYLLTGRVPTDEDIALVQKGLAGAPGAPVIPPVPAQTPASAAGLQAGAQTPLIGAARGAAAPDATHATHATDTSARPEPAPAGMTAAAAAAGVVR